MIRRAFAALPVQPPFLRPPSRPIASCFGAGGAFGISFCMGVVQGLLDAGVPVDRGPMLGTSAGAWTAASVATGIDHDDLVEASSSYVRSDAPAQVIEITRSVFGDRRDGRVSGMVLQFPPGLRRSLSGDEHPLAEVVAASSSPPRIAAPHRIHGRRYIDAGILRNTSADRAESARVLVVVAPFARHVLGVFGRMSENTTRFEMQQWRLRTGGDVLFIRPTKSIAALLNGNRVEALLDVEVAHRAYTPSYELGVHRAEEFLWRNPEAAEEFHAVSC